MPTTTTTDTTNTAGKWGYLALFQNKRAEVWTNDGIAAAKDTAAAQMGVKPRDRYKISILPCIRPDGSEVIHTPDF